MVDFSLRLGRNSRVAIASQCIVLRAPDEQAYGWLDPNDYSVYALDR